MANLPFIPPQGSAGDLAQPFLGGVQAGTARSSVANQAAQAAQMLSQRREQMAMQQQMQREAMDQRAQQFSQTMADRNAHRMFEVQQGMEKFRQARELSDINRDAQAHLLTMRANLELKSPTGRIDDIRAGMFERVEEGLKQGKPLTEIPEAGMIFPHSALGRNLLGETGQTLSKEAFAKQSELWKAETEYAGLVAEAEHMIANGAPPSEVSEAQRKAHGVKARLNELRKQFQGMTGQAPRKEVAELPKSVSIGTQAGGQVNFRTSEELKNLFDEGRLSREEFEANFAQYFPQLLDQQVMQIMQQLQENPQMPGGMGQAPQGPAQGQIGMPQPRERIPNEELRRQMEEIERQREMQQSPGQSMRMRAFQTGVGLGAR